MRKTGKKIRKKKFPQTLKGGCLSNNLLFEMYQAFFSIRYLVVHSFSGKIVQWLRI
jgi:hypothetical protein